MNTPIHYSTYLSELTGTEFYFKREDLISEGGGGNKARMVRYILDKAKSQSADFLLTAGGPHSNFNRALALMASKEKLPLRVVLYDKNSHLQNTSFNKRICDWQGVEYAHCSPEEVADTIQNQLDLLVRQGHNPYFIWGGGKSVEGTMAYFDAVKEIKEYNQFSPDLLVTTLATGTTFSGLAVGVDTFFPEARVWGISIARKKEEAWPVISDSIQLLRKKVSFPSVENKEHSYFLNDEFVMGGYGKISPECREFIQQAGRNTGLILDEIYVGKALYGAVQSIRESTKWANKKVIFLLTGGVFNF